MSKRLLAASCALALGLSACGSSSNNSSTTASAGAGGTTTASSSARYQARLNLAKCMRAHGVDVPDPSAGGGFGGGEGLLRQVQSSPNYQSAIQACSKYLRGSFAFANLSPAQRAQFQQALVRFAECMRAHGVNVPDPTTTGTGGGFGIRRAFGSVDRNSPGFRSALQTCRSSLPFRPGAGGGAPGPGPAPGG